VIEAVTDWSSIIAIVSIVLFFSFVAALDVMEFFCGKRKAARKLKKKPKKKKLRYINEVGHKRQMRFI
jgi:hypothetical protein